MVQELIEVYIHTPGEHSIGEIVKTIRFVAKLIGNLPNLHSNCRKNGKAIVMFHQQVNNLIRDYVKPQMSSVLLCKKY